MSKHEHHPFQMNDFLTDNFDLKTIIKDFIFTNSETKNSDRFELKK